MGRVRHKYTKRMTRKVMENAEFTSDFEENKVTLSAIADISSKKIRNVIAGYATKLAKAKKY